MSNAKHAKFATDLMNAVGSVMAAHGYQGVIEIGGDQKTGSILIKIAPASQSSTISPNAIKRYQKHGPAMGLPAPGTELEVDGLTLSVLGLSTDLKRVKAKCNNPKCGAVHELPVEVTKTLVEAIAMAKASKMEAREAKQGDTVDPAVSEALAKMMSASK